MERSWQRLVGMEALIVATGDCQCGLSFRPKQSSCKDIGRLGGIAEPISDPKQSEQLLELQ